MAGFEGMAELIRDIERLGEGGAEAAERGLLRGAGEIVMAAKVATPERTGRARRSIHVGGHPELSGDFNPGGDRGWYGDMGNYNSSAGSQRAVEVGSDLFYFQWLEEGGGGRKRNSRGRGMLGHAVEMVAPRIEFYVMAEVDALARDVGL